jgi:hypothetical protein
MMQQTLSLYQELKENYIPKHLERLFRLFSDKLWHSTDEVIKVAGKQYNARIFEMRKEGFEIVSKKINGKFGFTLEHIYSSSTGHCPVHDISENKKVGIANS